MEIEKKTKQQVTESIHTIVCAIWGQICRKQTAGLIQYLDFVTMIYKERQAGWKEGSGGRRLYWVTMEYS